MPLPEDFQFSQSSIKDYLDCRRRFYLRYIQKQPWPAITIEPALEHEREIQLGTEFHRMVQRHLLGISAERISKMADDEKLIRWWNNYLHVRPGDVSGERRVEFSLACRVGNYKMIAKYDLLVITPSGDAIILDWKTTSKRTLKPRLLRSPQTRVYRYVLVSSISQLTQGHLVQPDKVKMIYWFADFPNQPEELPYNPAEYQKDGEFFEGLIKEIAGLADTDFKLTDEIERCQYCQYRSLCERGQSAGKNTEDLDDLDDDETPLQALDLDRIEEIAF